MHTQTFDLGAARDIDWSPSGAVTRSAWGELTGDARMDAVFLDGDDAYLVYAPEKHNAILLANSSSSPANDVAVLPSATPGEAGDLIVVGASGLFRLEFSYGTTPGFSATAIGSHVDWQGATRVEVADIDRDGNDDLIGLKPGGKKVLVTYGPAFSGTFGLNLPHRVVEICALNWNDIGSGDLLEVAALSPDHGVYVFAPDGGGGAFLSMSTLDGGAIAPLRDGGALGTHLAVLAVHDTGDEELITWRPSSTETLTLTSTDGAYALVADDVDGDGDDDVAIAHTGDQYLYLFENLTGVSGYDTFDDGYVESVDLSYTYSDMWPVLGDLQGSGLADLLTFAPTDDTLTFHDNENTDVNLGAPSVVYGEYFYYDDGVDEWAEVELVFSSMPSTPSPSSITHLQITQWTQDEWGYGALPSTPPPMDAVAATVDRIPYGALQSAGKAHVYLDGAAEFTDRVYHLELRFVEVDSGDLVWCGPSRTYAVTSNQDMTNVLKAAYPGAFTDFGLVYAVPDPSEPGAWELGVGDSRPDGDTGSTRTPDIPDPDGGVPDPDGGAGGGGAGGGGNG